MSLILSETICPLASFQLQCNTTLPHGVATQNTTIWTTEYSVQNLLWILQYQMSD